MVSFDYEQTVRITLLDDLSDKEFEKYGASVDPYKLLVSPMQCGYSNAWAITLHESHVIGWEILQTHIIVMISTVIR